MVKPLFNHIWEVLSNVPSFQSEYESILRHLLAIKDYRFHMRKRIYSCKFFTCLNLKYASLQIELQCLHCSNFSYIIMYSILVRLGLVLLYMEKVESSLGGKNDNQHNPREEIFRCILTLQSLLENPPGDLPNSLREDIVKGFVGIFTHIR